MSLFLIQFGSLLFGLGLGAFITVLLLILFFHVRVIQELFAPHWDELHALITNAHDYMRTRNELWQRRKAVQAEAVALEGRSDNEKLSLRHSTKTKLQELDLEEKQNEARATTVADGLLAVSLSIGVLGRLVFAGLILGLVAFGLISLHNVLPLELLSAGAFNWE